MKGLTQRAILVMPFNALFAAAADRAVMTGHHDRSAGRNLPVTFMPPLQLLQYAAQLPVLALQLSNLLLDSYFKQQIEVSQAAWRRVISKAVEMGIPVPAMSSALTFFDGYRRDRLPANLLQAQRDYFGAHTYERLDKPRGQFFHTNWTGKGGDVTSNAYIA